MLKTMIVPDVMSQSLQLEHLTEYGITATGPNTMTESCDPSMFRMVILYL